MTRPAPVHCPKADTDVGPARGLPFVDAAPDFPSAEFQGRGER
jgi:hypothetical protein